MAEQECRGNNILFTMFSRQKNHDQHLEDLGKMLVIRILPTGGKVSITESTGGPPAGSDLQIKLFGDNLTILNQYADKIENHLKTMQG